MLGLVLMMMMMKVMTMLLFVGANEGLQEGDCATLHQAASQSAKGGQHHHKDHPHHHPHDHPGHPNHDQVCKRVSEDICEDKTEKRCTPAQCDYNVSHHHHFI